MKKFWLYFSSAYGTLWFVLFAVSLITQSNIQAGTIGYYGFPIVSAIYAYTKICIKSNNANRF